MRVQTPLTDVQEALVTATMDCGFAVHRELGPGFKEAIYATALCLELNLRGLKFEREKAIDVKYREWTIPGQRVDLIVESLIIVEVKTIPSVRSLHQRQVLSYLRTTGLPIGLIMNFNTERLIDGFRRVVLTRLPISAIGDERS
jgi:GxxExxY protein